MSIFISYRRSDTQGAAGRLADRLTQRFGRDAVVIDVDTDQAGRDYRDLIAQHLEEAQIVLALIGGSFLEEDAAGLRRIDDQGDLVRAELARALERDVRVVPVLVDGARMPRKEELPDDVADLAFRGFVELAHHRYESDYADLERRVARLLETAPVGGARAAGAAAAGPPRSDAASTTAKLTLLLSPRSPTATVGESLRWTVTLRNDGGDALRDVVVQRGLRLFDSRFDLEAGRGRRFTFATTFEDPGRKVETVQADAISSAGARVHQEATASVLVGAPPEAPERRSRPKPAPKVSAPARPGEVGVVSHYFDRIGVAGVVITGEKLVLGDHIRIEGSGRGFTQRVVSMERDRSPVRSASRGDEVGIKVDQPVQERDRVFLARAAQQPGRGALVGSVVHYWDRIGVAGIRLTGGRIALGDTIAISTGGTVHRQVVKSMQVDYEPVREARAGTDVAVKVDRLVHKGDEVRLDDDGG